MNKQNNNSVNSPKGHQTKAVMFTDNKPTNRSNVEHKKAPQGGKGNTKGSRNNNTTTYVNYMATNNNTTNVNSRSRRQTEAERFTEWLKARKEASKPKFNVFKALVPEALAERIEEACAEPEEIDCWTEKTQQSPEVYYFLQVIEETREELFGGPNVVEFREEIHGHKNANDNQYDGSYDELSSDGFDMGESDYTHESEEYEYFVFKKERDDESAEPKGERDTTTQSLEREINSNWLKSQFATLAWAFKQLSADVQIEMKKQYRKYMKYMQLRARDIHLKLSVEIDEMPRSNRSYTLNYEERELFEPVFREQHAEKAEDHGFTRPKAKKPKAKKAKVKLSFADWIEEVKKASKK